MAKLTWDDTGKRFFETGVDRGVLYPRNAATGLYPVGVAWNGLTAVTESPDGAEPQVTYADNIPYVTIMSAEAYKATIEALTYPAEWEACDGSLVPATGILLGQQPRQTFGMCYRTKLGNDSAGMDYGYKLHIFYGGLAAPSERGHATVNDSPEAMTLSWEVSTTPVSVTGFKDTATLVIDSTKITPTALTALELILYGTAGVDPRLPLPDEIVTLVGSATSVTPTVPTYTPATHTITIPTVTGVTYRIDGVIKTGSVVLTAGQQVIVVASPNVGYYFPANTDVDWQFTY